MPLLRYRTRDLVPPLVDPGGLRVVGTTGMADAVIAEAELALVPKPKYRGLLVPQFESLNLPPVFNWGGRIGSGPPQQRYPGWLNINRTQDFVVVYIDAIGDRSDEISAGFGVGMGLPPEEAKKLVLARQDVLQNVKAESKKEADARQKEIAADYKAAGRNYVPANANFEGFECR